MEKTWGNDLMSIGTQLLPEPIMTYHMWGSRIHLLEISQGCSRLQSVKRMPTVLFLNYSHTS